MKLRGNLRKLQKLPKSKFDKVLETVRYVNYS